MKSYDPARTERGLEEFANDLTTLFEAWVSRRSSLHTQRAYRNDMKAFFRFLGHRWPEEARELFRISTSRILQFRVQSLAENAAPKTVNRRIASLSSFYKYLGNVAAERQLPITVPNPAHAQFIPRSASAARKVTKALTAEHARELMAMPQGESVLAYRDRAILKTFLYTGIRLGTGCRLRVKDFRQEGGVATLRLRESGSSRRTIGVHASAAHAIADYIARANLTSGPLFRARKQSRTEELSKLAMNEATMYRTIDHYLCRLPDALVETRNDDDTVSSECLYTPHSLRATTASLLLDADVEITKVQQLLGHRHVATTQAYDRRRRSPAESASHDVPI